MADRIVTAVRTDRTPNWDKWRQIPEPRLWQCVALSLNIDPDSIEIDSVFGRDPILPRRPREFGDRIDIARENLHRTLRCTAVAMDRPLQSRVSLRGFAIWVRQLGWTAPAELLAMADDHNCTPSDMRTAAAAAKRTAKKTDRLDDLRQFIDDVYAAANHGDFALGTGNDRKPLPFPKGDLFKLFAVRHRGHAVAQATFEDDLNRINVKVRSGKKRVDIKQLAEMMAVKL